MTAAIMQPYLFPYLGYYQLAFHADTFVMYDDAHYIKQGFINRNSILLAGRPHRFTVPVPRASSNARIRELEFSNDTAKILKTLSQTYARAPHVDAVGPVVERVLESDDRSIPVVCRRGVEDVFDYLGLEVRIVFASDLDYDRGAPATEKLIQICDAVEADHYVNSIGGRHLYRREDFASRGVPLGYLVMEPVHYDQQAPTFVPNLSIIDALMWCDPAEVRRLLKAYRVHDAFDLDAEAHEVEPT